MVPTARIFAYNRLRFVGTITFGLDDIGLCQTNAFVWLFETLIPEIYDIETSTLTVPCDCDLEYNLINCVYPAWAKYNNICILPSSRRQCKQTTVAWRYRRLTRCNCMLMRIYHVLANSTDENSTSNLTHFSMTRIFFFGILRRLNLVW